jgi:hypothetical protein
MFHHGFGGWCGWQWWPKVVVLIFAGHPAKSCQSW